MDKDLLHKISESLRDVKQELYAKNVQVNDISENLLSHVHPLSPGIKLQILLLCFHTFLTEVVKISIAVSLSDHVLNSQFSSLS